MIFVNDIFIVGVQVSCCENEFVAGVSNVADEMFSNHYVITQPGQKSSVKFLPENSSVSSQGAHTASQALITYLQICFLSFRSSLLPPNPTSSLFLLIMADIKMLTEMGFSTEMAREAMTAAGGNVELALELLTSDHQGALIYFT